MTRLGILICLAASCARADVITVSLDAATSLNDGTTFASATTYYSAFQLTAGASSASAATIYLFDLGGGSPVAPSAFDPNSGTFLITPDPASLAGIFQNSGALTLSIDPSNAYSLYTQQFVAGSRFQFTAALNGLYSGGTPDSFAFQLYDAGLNNLLYEQDFAILNTVPEPTLTLAVALALTFFLSRRYRNAARRSKSVGKLDAHMAQPA